MSAPTLTRATAEAATVLPCPKFCDGSCEEWRDEDGSTSHWGDFAAVNVDSFDRQDIDLSVTLTRVDTGDGRSDAEVHLITGEFGEDYIFSAAKARKLASGLLNAADQAEPLPGVSPENPSDRTRNLADLQSCAPAQDSACPSWCGDQCKLDAADGSIYHMGSSVSVGDVEVGLSRLDAEDDGPGPATVDVLIGMASAELTPAQALALADVLREQALTAARTAVTS